MIPDYYWTSGSPYEIPGVSILRTLDDVSVKRALSQHVERVNHLINKIFTKDLDQTQQRAMGKIVERAEKILEKMKKSL